MQREAPAATGQPHVVLLGAANSIHLQRWALALHARGRRISVVSQHAALPLPAGIAVHALPVAGGAGYLLNAWPLRRLLERLRPDLLHVHYASGYGTLARLTGWRPSLLSVWGSDVYAFPTRSALHAAWLRANLRAAQALASTSAAMADRVRQLWPDAGPIAITPFGVDTALFSPGAGERLAGQSLTIGTVKSLAPTYGIDLLLQAFAALRQRRPALPLRLLVVGGGPQRAELQAQARQLGLGEVTEFIGPVEHAEVPSWLQRIDIFVAPSRHESFGVAVIEAMACGLPVVVSDAGGLPEVVEHGVSGLVAPVGNPAALADALASLADDVDLRRRLAHAARRRAVEIYDWRRCVDNMIECQDAVLAGAAPAR